MKYLRFHDTRLARTPRAQCGAGRAAPRARSHAGWPATSPTRAAGGGELFVPSRPIHDDLLRCDARPGRRNASWPSSRPKRSSTRSARAFAERSRRRDYLAWMSYVTLKTKFVEDFLQRLDKMGMQHSVEGRVPLVDPRLVHFAFRLDQV